MYPSHKIRVVEERNPAWYSKLYYQYSYFRRNRSLRALERIVNKDDIAFTSSKKYAPYSYHSRYREFLYDILTRGYNVNGYDIPANEKVCRYFGVKSVGAAIENLPD